MPEAFIYDLRLEDAHEESVAETRERLKGCFPPGAARRLTQLGMLVGSVMKPFGAGGDDAVVYASTYGESRSMEAFLDSFPAASPMLFQTSIHPSGVQQGQVVRQTAVRELYPFSGFESLVSRAVLGALLTRAPRTLLCGGEERGTWLCEHGLASTRSFAFALALGGDRGAATLGRLAIEQQEGIEGFLSLASFFEALAGRTQLDLGAAPGWHLRMEWF